MRVFKSIIAVFFLIPLISGCGVKGKLKTPAQIEQEAQKAAAKNAAEEEKKEEEK